MTVKNQCSRFSSKENWGASDIEFSFFLVFLLGKFYKMGKFVFQKNNKFRMKKKILKNLVGKVLKKRNENII